MSFNFSFFKKKEVAPQSAEEIARNSVSPYLLWQLDHATLIHLENKKTRGEELSEKESRAVQLYIDLTSNYPRVDIEMNRYFNQKDRDYAYETQDIKKINIQKRQRKVRSAYALKKLGFYHIVAEGNTKNINDFIFLTKSFNEVHWVDAILKSKAKKNLVKIYNPDARSTSTHDIIESFGELYLCMSLGRVSFKTMNYVNKML